MKEKELKQDLNDLGERPGAVFVIRLLMDKPCGMPNRDNMIEIMNKHLENVECMHYDKKMVDFVSKKYLIKNDKEIELPVHLLISECAEITKPIMDDIAKTQLWDVENEIDILDSCNYQVVATDFLTDFLNYKDRSNMLVGYIEALVELYPTCKAVVFDTSKKMLKREDIVNCKIPKEHRFIHYAVNIRYFNIIGTDDMLVDTIGMSTLFLPDLQYHFHGINPDQIINHAYNFLKYIFDNDNPIKNGDTIDGLKNKDSNEDLKWEVQYEDSLIQPIREVIDVNTLEHASGNR